MECDHVLGWDTDDDGGEMIRASELLPAGVYAQGGVHVHLMPYKYLAREYTHGFHPAKHCSECGAELDHSKYNGE